MDNTSLIAGLSLVLSNFIAVPVVAKAVRLRKYMEACIVTVLFFNSFFYHICQAGFACIVSLENHQIIDHYSVWGSFIWMALYLVQTDTVPKVCVYVIAQSFLLPSIIKWRDSWALAGVVIAVTLLIVVAIVMYKKSIKYDALDLACAIILVAVGLVFFWLAGDPGDKGYPPYHSIWHTTSIGSYYFIVAINDGEGEISKLVSILKESF